MPYRINLMLKILKIFKYVLDIDQYSLETIFEKAFKFLSIYHEVSSNIKKAYSKIKKQ